MSSSRAKCPAPTAHVLGEVVVEFGILEFFLEAAIWQFLAPQGKARFLMAQAITAEMSFDRKVHAFASMSRLRDPAGAACGALVKDLFAVQGARNALLHSVWNSSGTFRTVTRMKASAKATRGLVRRLYSMRIDDVEAARDRIVAVANHLARVMAKIQGEGAAG